MKKDFIVIGAGASGVSAAVYLKRAGQNVLVIEKGKVGGILNDINKIENYLGFASVSGSELANNMQAQLKQHNIELVYENVLSLSLASKTKKIKTDKNVYTAKTVIICGGATSKRLGVEGEENFIGRGVSYCAVCDGAFFKGREVAVVGNSVNALKDALYLSKFAKKVYVVFRRLKSEKDLELEKTYKIKNIELVFDAAINKISGNKIVESIEIKQLKSGKTWILAVSGVFITIGKNPDTQMLLGQVMLDKSGYIKVDKNYRTNLEGVYAAGDITNAKLKQVITAASGGAVAATCAMEEMNKSLNK